MEDTDDETEDTKGILPSMKVGQVLDLNKLEGVEKFSSPPARYTEASLVKKLEELGIGRPSTYAPTISTIQNRGYVSREDRPGEKRMIEILTLKGGKISTQSKTEVAGREKSKLFPQSIGMIVTDFNAPNSSLRILISCI